MSHMFSNATSFTGGTMSSTVTNNMSLWNTMNVTNMSGMFYKASSFQGDISNWNTSNVIYMSGMFHSASSFHQNNILSLWDVSNVTSMNYMFYNATAFQYHQNLLSSTWKNTLANLKYTTNIFNNTENTASSLPPSSH